MGISHKIALVSQRIMLIRHGLMDPLTKLSPMREKIMHTFIHVPK